MSSQTNVSNKRFVREEGFTADEAASKWQEDVSNPAIKRQTKNGILKLAVQGHDMFVTQQGAQKRQTLTANRQEAESMEDKRRLHKKAKRFHDASDAQFQEVGGDLFRDGAAARAGAEDGDMDDAFGPGSEDDIFPDDSLSGIGSRGESTQGPRNMASVKSDSSWRRTPQKESSGAGSAAPSSLATSAAPASGRRRPDRIDHGGSDGDSGGACPQGSGFFPCVSYSQ